MISCRRAAPALACILLAVLGLSGCKSSRMRNTIGPGEERRIGAHVAGQIEAHNKIVMDGKINRRVQDIAQPVFDQAAKERGDITYRIRVVDDPAVNAFSLPGGYVYLYRGLIDKLGTDDDALACVIGHEAAHVVKRHSVRQMSDAQGKGLLVDLAAILTNSNAVGQVGGTLAELDFLHFSREDEYEADRDGERFAYNAGYDPSGMLRLFHVLQEMEKKNGGSAPGYALDHPINRNRALRALEQLRELRVNKGQYVSKDYDPRGDQAAAALRGIDYQTLVLATPPPAALDEKDPKTKK
jgi:beta-barrel assembly-enhancing protease